MQDTYMIVPLASGDLVASGAKYDGCFNLTICGNRYRSFVRNQNDNPYVDIERLSLCWRQCVFVQIIWPSYKGKNSESNQNVNVIRIHLRERMLAQFAVSGLHEQPDGKRVVFIFTEGFPKMLK